MVQQENATSHVHKRKRIHVHKEPYPHPNPWKNFLDKIIYLIALIGPISMIPQILKIYVEKNASSLSEITWTLLLFPAIIWTIYGIVHKEKPIICAGTSSLIIHILILIGVILY
jgi:uncharacterized protein with PQ loop repeat